MTVTISVIALFVSLFTLWLTQLRRGRLDVATPKHWAGIMTESKVIILLPIAIANTGTATRVVRDLRLTFLDQQHEPLEFVRTRNELRPETAGAPSFAAPFVVKPASATVRFCEFQRRPGRTPESGTWPVRLEVQTGDRPDEWRTLREFQWGISPEGVRYLNAFIAHRNAAAAR